MARPIVALALLAMLTIASAERSLLAHKPQGGMSVHGIALTTNVFYSTNGNGTWVGSTNGAYLAASSYPGSLSCVAAAGGALANLQILTCAAPSTFSYYLPSAVGAWGSAGFVGIPVTASTSVATASAAAANVNINGQSPASPLTAVTFPSKSLGVAVGLAQSLSPVNTITAFQGTAATSVPTTATSPFTQMVGTYAFGQPGNALSTSTVGATASFPVQYGSLPTILTTIDGGASWVAVTGFSAPSPSATVPTGGVMTVTSYPTTTAYVNGNLGPATLSPVDLTAVYCVSRSLCFAAGGFLPTASYTSPAVSTPTTSQVGGYSAAAYARTSVSSTFPQFGQILRSTNGGSFWTYTSLPTNVAPSNPLCQLVSPPNIGASLCPVPGLLAIGADASGKHVYATGAGSTPLFNPGDIQNPGTVTVATFGIPLPVILYSGNSGASYTVQTAPIMPNIYALSAVSVLRGTIAFAAGGNPYGTQGSTATPPQLVLRATAPFNVAGTAVATGGGAGSGTNTAGSPVPAGTTPVSLTAFNAPTLTSSGVVNLLATTTATFAQSPCPAAGLCNLPVGMIGAPIVPAQGVILATTNGGFSWIAQTIASYTYGCTAANTWGLTFGFFGYATPTTAIGYSVAASQNGAATGAPSSGGGYCSFVSQATSQSPQAGIAVTAGGVGAVSASNPVVPGSLAGLATNWQAYMPLATQASNTIPAINGLGFTSTLGKYNGWAVGDSGLVLKTSFAMTAVTNSVNAPVTSWTVVNGTAISSIVYASTGYANLYGITWDNSNTGYIYGNAVILSTHNAGATWAVESPNTMIIAQPQVVGLSAVPTTY
jgi:hypothetical protein